MAKKIVEVEDEATSVHVRIGIEAGIDSKKQLLVSQIDILRMMKGVNRYSQLRKRELELKQELKGEMKELHHTIRGFYKNMPQVEQEEKFKLRDDIASISKREIIESDLESIKRKLTKLGGL